MSAINESAIRIPSYLCGPDDRLTQAGLAALFQEEAWLHARSLGFDFTDPEVGVFWVLSRVVWQIREWPRWDQRLVARTWPSGLDRLLAVREFELRSEDRDAEPLVRATSGWVIMSSASPRPVPPKRHLDGRISFSERTLDVPLSRLTPPEPAPHAETTAWRPIPYAAIDRNRHVNNTAYLTFMTDLGPLPLPGPGRQAVVHYTAEAREGDRYRVRADGTTRWVEVSDGDGSRARVAASLMIL